MSLNQFRRVLNELIKQYGCPPYEIYLEMARETSLSAKDLAKLNGEHRQNRLANVAINEALEKLNVAPTYANRMKYKLWEDLDPDPSGRCCPLTGKNISLEKLFTPQIEVEHILPFSRSFDDSRNNKMVCFKSANQIKKNQTPYEAFGQSLEWDSILARAKKMSPGDHKYGKNARGFRVNKFWRFLPDAMQRMQMDEGSFIARQLNDTKYMSRMARRYAEFVTGKYPGKGGRRVFAIKGKFTADLRHHWGLGELVGDFKDGKFNKDRTNHHHHAIDAIVIALSDQSMVRKLAKANKKARITDSTKMYIDVPPPFWGFSTQSIKERLKTLVISHKPDHKSPQKARQRGTSIGQLHEDTNYGHMYEHVYATRKPLIVDNFDSQKNIDEIASRDIREAVRDRFLPYADIKGKLKSTYKKEYHEILEAYKKDKNIKKVRIHLPKDNLIPIHDKTGKVYRYVIGGNNFCADIWVSEKVGKWQCEVIRNFDVNQKGFMPQWRQENPTAMKVMRLQINDMVAVGHGKERKIYQITGMGTSKQIFVRDHNIMSDKTSFYAGSLQQKNARKIYISPTGKIYDPGHAKRPKWDK